MSKKLIQVLFLGVLGSVMVGCASTNKAQTGGVTTRAYIADKERIDQEMTGGNQGYLMGTPQDRGDYKKTRKVYVVEFTKELPEDASSDSLIPPARPKPARQPAPVAPNTQEPEWAKPVALPPIESLQEDRPVPEPPVVEGCQDYTVQKGDTLQKIAKKFYGSYGKWAKIYEANKAMLEDPDQLKVGMVLCIPGAGAPAVKEEVDNLK